MTAAGAPPTGRIALDSFARSLNDRLGRVHSLDPRALAELFTYAGGPGERASVVRKSLHEFLLTRTVRHARLHTKYYQRQEYACSRGDGGDARPALVDMPILRRENVVEHFDEFVADDVTLRSIVHTSGTTGQPLNLFKSYEEIDFLQAYYSQLLRPIIDSLPTRPLVLTLPNVNHGVPVPMPGVGLTLVAGVTDDTLIQDARRVLLDTFERNGFDSRVSILTGLPHHVLLLTSYLLEQGIEPRDLGMKSVTVTGGFLSMNWIDFLQDSWGCMVNDRFTLTEAIGGASRIPGTDVFELDPHIVGEVVDPDTGRPTEESVGLLVLTNLYPFVQMLPLIRYTVGDLVRLVPGPGPLRFQFLGKVGNCVSWTYKDRREWLLFSARLNEVVNAFPDVNVYEWFSNVRVVQDRTIGSLPILSVSSTTDDGRLTLRVAMELRYAPHTRRERVAEIRRAITSGLVATTDTTLGAHLQTGDVFLNIDFVGPGGLKAPLVIKI